MRKSHGQDCAERRHLLARRSDQALLEDILFRTADEKDNWAKLCITTGEPLAERLKGTKSPALPR
jgi:hypothetical protein